MTLVVVRASDTVVWSMRPRTTGRSSGRTRTTPAAILRTVLALSGALVASRLARAVADIAPPLRPAPPTPSFRQIPHDHEAPRPGAWLAVAAAWLRGAGVRARTGVEEEAVVREYDDDDDEACAAAPARARQPVSAHAQDDESAVAAAVSSRKKTTKKKSKKNPAPKKKDEL